MFIFTYFCVDFSAVEMVLGEHLRVLTVIVKTLDQEVQIQSSRVDSSQIYFALPSWNCFH